MRSLIQPQPGTSAATPAENLQGAVLMCVAMAFFTMNDTVMKYVAQDLPLYQSIALRGLAILPILAIFARREGGLDLRVQRENRWPMVLRTVGEVASTVLFLNALTHMAISELSAILQSLPLLVTLAAAVMFGEQLGWRRMLAILIGLAGVMLILRPGSDAFDIWSVVGVGAVAALVLRDMATRMFSRAIRSSSIAFYAALSVTAAALVLSLGEGWRMPTLAQAGLLILAAMFLTIGYVTVIATMRVGEIGFVAPFRYVSLVVTIVLGLLVFGEWPDMWTWIGSALVVGAGVYTILRERRLTRQGRL
ncbi:MAG: DMT family transporter [Paracoccus sp. (in: a-proteobacteria)]|uniref:DMT family transporter n=1 Tax=Paracoccus sp. TaxID=267 RepID=UPI0026E0ACFF|nr:DMT family transporter [Paracoccus sp. (in: a-proteobacteria)]MDO5614529.1 DMT family transporter [Paracoccus sp. (in: a-proteobacteria)]